MTLLKRATGALAGSLRLQIGAGAFMAGRTDYVAERRDNLVPGAGRAMAGGVSRI